MAEQTPMNLDANTAKLAVMTSFSMGASVGVPDEGVKISIEGTPGVGAIGHGKDEVGLFLMKNGEKENADGVGDGSGEDRFSLCIEEGARDYVVAETANSCGHYHEQGAYEQVWTCEGDNS